MVDKPSRRRLRAATRSIVLRRAMMLVVTLVLLDLGQVLLGGADPVTSRAIETPPEASRPAAPATEPSCSNVSPLALWKDAVAARLMPWKPRATETARCGVNDSRPDLWVALR